MRAKEIVKQSMRGKPVTAGMLGIAIEPTYFDLEHYHVSPVKIVRMAKDAGANTLRVGMFSHQGHAYYPSRIAPEAPFLNGRDLLAEFEAECKKHGIRLLVYLNSKWVTDLYKEHPDWTVQFAGGRYRFPDASAQLELFPMCPNSPFMEKYFKKIVAEVGARSNAFGVYVDNFGIEPFCQCRFCRQAYGKDIPDRKKWQDPQTQTYLKWFLNKSLRIAKGIATTVRKANPRMRILFNYGIFWSETGRYSPENNEDMLRHAADGVHAESAVRFYGDSFEHINEQCAFGRSIGQAILTWVEYPMLPFSHVSCSALETKVKTAKVIANGGRPMVWSIPCAPLIDQKGMAGIKEVFQLVGRHQELFDNVSHDRFAGILFSSRSLREFCQGNVCKLDEYKKAFQGAHQMVIRNHLPYDFVLDSHLTAKNLKKYKFVVLPNVIYLSRSQCEAIRQYVRDGGAVFATYRTSLSAGKGRRGKDFSLKDVFGASYYRELGPQAEGFVTTYARFTTAHPINCDNLRESLFPVGGSYLGVKSSDGIANLLKPCRYYCDHPQPQTDYPAIIARIYGKGKVVYVPGEFFSYYEQKSLSEHARLFRQTVDWFVDGRLPIRTDLPDTVEVKLTTSTTRDRVIHLVNMTFNNARPVDYIAPVSGKRLSLRSRRRFKRAVDITTGRNVKIRKRKGHVELILPPLTGYNVIVLC